MDNLKQKKEEAVRKWKQLFEHKKEMEQKFLQYRNVDVYAQFGWWIVFREKARNRLFIRWFKEEDNGRRFTIRASETSVEGQGMYVAIIVENCNPHLKEITEEFDNTAAVLTSQQK